MNPRFPIACFLFVCIVGGTVPVIIPSSGCVWAQKPSPASDSLDKIEEKKPKGMTDDEWEKVKAKRPLPFDNGPSSIDVSKYPPEMQDIYQNTFTKRCSKCHTIARPINAPYALPEEWNRYIKKMMKKPGSGITPDVGKRIYQFLVYDSEVRKKDAIEKKMKDKAATSQGGNTK